MTTSWMNMQPGVTSSVPQSALAAQSADPMAELIKNISTPIDPELIRAATSSVAGSHVATMPSVFTRPIEQPQYGQIDRTPVVGAGNARGQGIGNAVIGTTNAIAAVVTKERQMKQDQVRDAAQKVLMAQQGIDEAKQALDAAHASGDTAGVQRYTQLIQQNQQARDAVFADPKMRKALAKGFNINFVDSSENKTEEHAAVQEALKNAKTFQQKRQAMQRLREQQNAAAASSFGQAFEKAQPQGLAPNVQAQQQLAIAQASQKIQQQALKDYMTFKASIYRSDRTVDAARVREIGAGILQQQRLAAQQDFMNQRFAQAEKMLGERFDQQLQLISARGREARKVADEIFADKEADPLNMYTKLRNAAETYQKNMIADTKSYQELQARRNKMYTDSQGNALTPDENDVRAVDYQIKLVHDAILNDKANAENFNVQANRMVSTFGLNDQNTDTGAAAGGESDSVGGTEYTDPFSYLDGPE